MIRRISLALFICFLFSACTSTNILKTVEDVLNSSTAVGNDDVVKGLKEALILGINQGANAVSVKDGYFSRPGIKIPWPEDVKKVENTLRSIGLAKEADKVIMSLNDAASDAAVKAKPIFISAIKSLSIKDAMGILKGNDDAATKYLKTNTGNHLVRVFKPSIEQSLKKVDATKYWGDIIQLYNQIPTVKKVDPDLTSYVTNKAIDGLFTMVAKEEKKIRKDPLARTTDLLKKVFKLQD